MKEKDKHTIDELFRQKLTNFEINAHDTSWAAFKHVVKTSTRLKRLFLWKIIGALFAVTMIGVATYVTIKKPVGETITVQQKDNSELNNENKNEGHDMRENTPFYQIIKQTITAEDEVHTESTISDDSKQLQNPFIKDTPFSEVEVDVKSSDFEYAIPHNSVTNYSYFNKDDKQENLSSLGTEIDLNVPNGYAPIIGPNEDYMFFTSNTPVTDKEIKKGIGKERVYYAEKKEGKWSDTRILKHEINASENYNSAIFLSKDGQTLYLYRDDKKGTGNFYKSELKNGQWSFAEQLPEPINSSYNESSLFVSEDESTIFFTSDRPGGYGGLDIWCSEKDKSGIWKEPINLGPKINTSEDEEGVYVSNDGKTLFFSSKGHEGFGGYDVFCAKWEDNRWSEPFNLGEKVNTVNDDVYYVLNKQENKAFYTTSNPKTGERKVVQNKVLIAEKRGENEEESKIVLKGIVSAESDNNLHPTIAVLDDGNNRLKSIENNVNGGFSVELERNKSYKLYVQSEGYLFFKENIVTDIPLHYNVIEKQIILSKLSENTAFPIQEISTFHELDNKTKELLADLAMWLQKNPTIQLKFAMEGSEEVISETNNFLRMCKSYMLENGINEDRIDYEVWGNMLINKEKIRTLWMRVKE